MSPDPVNDHCACDISRLTQRTDLAHCPTQVAGGLCAAQLRTSSSGAGHKRRCTRGEAAARDDRKRRVHDAFRATVGGVGRLSDEAWPGCRPHLEREGLRGRVTYARLLTGLKLPLGSTTRAVQCLLKRVRVVGNRRCGPWSPGRATCRPFLSLLGFHRTIKVDGAGGTYEGKVQDSPTLTESVLTLAVWKGFLPELLPRTDDLVQASYGTLLRSRLFCWCPRLLGCHQGLAPADAATRSSGRRCDFRHFTHMLGRLQGRQRRLIFPIRVHARTVPALLHFKLSAHPQCLGTSGGCSVCCAFLHCTALTNVVYWRWAEPAGRLGGPGRPLDRHRGESARTLPLDAELAS